MLMRDPDTLNRSLRQFTSSMIARQHSFFHELPVEVLHHPFQRRSKTHVSRVD
jgi:hypothetical protein